MHPTERMGRIPRHHPVFLDAPARIAEHPDELADEPARLHTAVRAGQPHALNRPASRLKSRYKRTAFARAEFMEGLRRMDGFPICVNSVSRKTDRSRDDHDPDCDGSSSEGTGGDPPGTFAGRAALFPAGRLGFF